MVKDLTQGKPSKVLWLFCLPLLVGTVFQQLYNMADSIIAGKVLGEDALAAVGASYPLTMIFTAVALGVNLGCSVVISKLFGEKKIDELKTGVSTVIIAASVLGVVMTLVGVLSGKAIMQVLGTPANIMADCMDYLYVYIGGFLFVLIYNVSTGIFAALGDSKTPLYFLIASSVANVGMNLVFTMVVPLGVAGLAWATFMTQGLAAILCAATLAKRVSALKGTEGVRPARFSAKLLKAMCFVAIPSVLQQSFVSVGNLLIQSLINGYGSSVMAGFTAATKLNTFIITTVVAVAGGLSSFAAQNLGAGQVERVRSGARISLFISLVMTLPFTLAYTLAPEFMLSLFLEESSAAAVTTGVTFLTIVPPFYFVVSVKTMLDSILRGAQSMLAFMSTTFADLLFRVVLCFALNPVLGITGMSWAWSISWCIGTALSIALYLSHRWYKSAAAKRKFAALATYEEEKRLPRTKREFANGGVPAEGGHSHLLGA